VDHSLAKPSLDRAIQLADRGDITEDSYSKLLAWLGSRPTRNEWTQALRTWSLVLGFALIISGVLYFGAFNWNALGRLQKLGLLELILSGLFLGTLSRGLESKEGHVLLVSASALVGGLLAVYGQVYQTGADSYLLFVGWSALIFLWCCAGRSNVLWMLEFCLLNTSFTLWWSQTKEYSDATSFGPAFLLLNLALAGLWEWRRKGSPWMNSYPTEILIFAALTPITLMSCAFIFDWEEAHFNLLLLLTTLAVLMGLRHSVLATRATLSTSFLCLGTSLLIKIFMDAMDLEVLGILLVGLGILAQLGLVVKWLSSLHRQEKSSRPPLESQPETPESSPAITAPERLAADLEIPLEDAVAAYSPPTEMPWYVQLLIGTGAWIASLFVMAFFLVWFTQADFLLVGYGITLYLASLKLRERSESVFMRQSLMSLHLAGQLVTVFALADLLDSNEAFPGLVGMLLTLISVWKFKDRLGRFLFGAGFVGCGLWTASALLDELGASLWLLLVAGALAWTGLRHGKFLSTSHKTLFLPAYRGACAAFLTCSLFPIFDKIDLELRMLLAIGFAATTVWAAWRLNQPPIAVLGLLIFGALTNAVPTIMAAVLVYILGFFTRQKLIQALAIMTLLGSGSFFYYDLDLTLLMKSVTLLLSGSCLLGLRMTIRQVNQETEETQRAL
jgi:uncharacterized membrane protein